MGFKPSLYLQIISHMFYYCATGVQQGHLDIEGQLIFKIVHDVPGRGRVQKAENDQVEGNYHKVFPLMKDTHCLEQNVSFLTYF
jgi:hypothetical protein